MRTMILFLLAAAACGGSDPANPDGPPGGPDAGGDAPDFRVDRSGTIAFVEGSGVYAALHDRSHEQPMPTRIAAAGDCATYRRPTPTCPGGCDVNQVCDADNQCVAGALFTDAGDITVTGLREPVTLTPTPYGYDSPILPADFFADDAAIHVSAAGGDIPAFAADVGGVVPLVHQIAGKYVELNDGEDETIRWTPGSGDARIQVALYLGWHGMPWTDLLICETADDGELVIPSATIDPMSYLEGAALFQWPSWIARYRRAWVTTPVGDIEIIAASQSPLGVVHLMP
jgi:hypothetical protein